VLINEEIEKRSKTLDDKFPEGYLPTGEQAAEMEEII
jgi:hypothetical protein